MNSQNGVVRLEVSFKSKHLIVEAGTGVGKSLALFDTRRFVGG